MTSQPLFRQEAIEFQRTRQQWGSVATLQPVSTKVFTWLLALAAAGLVAFVLLASYTRKETAAGYLTPTGGTAKIFVPRAGTIRSVNVKEGEVVTSGQPLLVVDTDQIASDGLDVNASLLHTLVTQRQLLSATIDSEERRAETERYRLSSLVKGLQQELSQLGTQKKLQVERLSVANTDLDAGQQLRSKAVLTDAEVRRRQMAALEQQQAMSAIDQQISAKESQLVELQSALAQLPTIIGQKVQSLRNELSTADQRILEIKGRTAYVVRAPVSGRVSTLQATTGQNAQPQRLQLEIIPDESTLHAEIFVPARAIGFVEVGQTVRLLFDAFPYQHFGTYPGRVASISQAMLVGTESGGPLKLNEPAYRVIATLESQHVEVKAKKVALQPDMLLRADILLERRSLADWLLAPLRSVRM